MAASPPYAPRCSRRRLRSAAAAARCYCSGCCTACSCGRGTQCTRCTRARRQSLASRLNAPLTPHTSLLAPHASRLDLAPRPSGVVPLSGRVWLSPSLARTAARHGRGRDLPTARVRRLSRLVQPAARPRSRLAPRRQARGQPGRRAAPLPLPLPRNPQLAPRVAPPRVPPLRRAPPPPRRAGEAAAYSPAISRGCRLHLPISAVLGRITKTCLASLFSKSVPAADQALVLSVLDIGNSAINVVAPLYGGSVVGRLGVASQPLLAAAHYALLLAPTALVVRRAESEAARRGGGAKPKEL